MKLSRPVLLKPPSPSMSWVVRQSMLLLMAMMMMVELWRDIYHLWISLLFCIGIIYIYIYIYKERVVFREKSLKKIEVAVWSTELLHRTRQKHKLLIETFNTSWPPYIHLPRQAVASNGFCIRHLRCINMVVDFRIITVLSKLDRNQTNINENKIERDSELISWVLY
jgi:hypothetical protein